MGLEVNATLPTGGWEKIQQEVVAKLRLEELKFTKTIGWALGKKIYQAKDTA